jgi:hypothetical protein
MVVDCRISADNGVTTLAASFHVDTVTYSLPAKLVVSPDPVADLPSTSCKHGTLAGRRKASMIRFQASRQEC